MMQEQGNNSIKELIKTNKNHKQLKPKIMLRQQTKEKYKNAIAEMKDKKVVWNPSDIANVSYQRFDSFVILSMLRNGGFTNQDGSGKECINPKTNIEEAIKWIELEKDEAYKRKLEKTAREKIDADVKKAYTYEKQTQLNLTSRASAETTTDHERAIRLLKKLRDMGYEVTCRKIVEL
jgi:Tol biopolymer transport system component